MQLPEASFVPFLRWALGLSLQVSLLAGGRFFHLLHLPQDLSLCLGPVPEVGQAVSPPTFLKGFQPGTFPGPLQAWSPPCHWSPEQP